MKSGPFIPWWSLREYLSLLTPGDPSDSLDSGKDSGVYVRAAVAPSLPIAPRGRPVELIETEERQQTCSAPSITSSGLCHGVAAHFHDGGRSHAPRIFFPPVFPRGTTQRWGCKWERDIHPHSPGRIGTCDRRARKGKIQWGRRAVFHVPSLVSTIMYSVLGVCACQKERERHRMIKIKKKTEGEWGRRWWDARLRVLITFYSCPSISILQHRWRNEDVMGCHVWKVKMAETQRVIRDI